MRVAIGSPVKGLQLKTAVKAHLEGQGHDVIDVGVHSADEFVKYTAVGERVAEALQQGRADVAISICGSGTGAAIAVGKFRGVAAVACESVQTARLIRVVNGANCLCMGEDVVSPERACEMVDAFLDAQFQDAPQIPTEVLDFWAEARDEMMGRGDEAEPRDLETLD